MREATPRISVVICAYTLDRWDDLVEAVQSVQMQDLPAFEIMVVIDHNPPMLERVRRDLAGVVSVENREERGLSGARNSGIEVARGDIVAFLDDDAMAERGWIRELSEGYRNERILGVGGAIRPLWLTGRPAWFPEEFSWVVGCSYRGMPTSEAPVRNLIGANMSFRRAVFVAVGGFRSGIGRVGTLPVGCEETEMCIRAQSHWPHGIWLYKPQATVDHRVPGHRVRPTYFLARCYAEGISKALVAKLVGVDQGLASERTYTMRTLPVGVAHGVADALFRSDPWGLARAVAIVAGLLTTASGFGIGRLRGVSNTLVPPEADRVDRIPPTPAPTAGGR